MATFPSLEPTGRVVSLGDIPQGNYVGVSGDVVRFKTGSDRVNQQLTLVYDYLTESQAQEIIDHYRGQQGSLDAFDLPAIVWSGYSSRPISASDYEWRYAGTFDLSVASPSRYNVTIELVSVPI